MRLFLKGLLIGIAKVIPGVSGAMIAVNLGIYDKLINSITCFFDDKKNNFKFLFSLGSGIFLAIILFSNIISYLLEEYYISLMMLFLGLIVGGMISYSKRVKYSIKNIIIIVLVVLLTIYLSYGKTINNYILNGTFKDNLMYFMGGVIEIFSSIVPGISGTALLMLVGMYNNILVMMGNVYNISFVLDNIMLYMSYGLGLGISFVFFSLVINYLLKKYRMLFDTIVMGLNVSSVILLIMITFSEGYLLLEIIIGVVLFFLGILISYLFEK